MKDPIERQDAIDAIKAIPDGNWSSRRYVTAIKELPSARPESPEIIRCKDCRHYNAGFECLKGYGIERNREWYCGDAERRTDDELLSAQPEIIRCKDCENWDKTWTNDFPPNHYYCPVIDGVRGENFYCADAERREE